MAGVILTNGYQNAKFAKIFPPKLPALIIFVFIVTLDLMMKLISLVQLSGVPL